MINSATSQRDDASDTAVPLESVLCTEELHRRPFRPPDYEKEERRSGSARSRTRRLTAHCSSKTSRRDYGGSYLFSGLIPFLKNVVVLKPEAVNLACDNRFGRDRSTKAAD